MNSIQVNPFVNEWLFRRSECKIECFNVDGHYDCARNVDNLSYENTTGL